MGLRGTCFVLLGDMKIQRVSIGNVVWGTNYHNEKSSFVQPNHAYNKASFLRSSRRLQIICTFNNHAQIKKQVDASVRECLLG